MGKIVVRSNNTRKNGLPLLGEGCRNCSYRSTCSLGSCNIIARRLRQGMTEMGGEYLFYKSDMGFETYIRKYRYGYFMMIRGESHKSGELDNEWRIRFYDKDMAAKNFLVGGEKIQMIDDGDKRYLYVKYFKQDYGINDMIPLENGKGIVIM